MANQILLEIIGGCDNTDISIYEARKKVNKMPVSKAREIVAKFYERITILTLGYSNPHLDFCCQRALEQYGLGFLA